MKAIGRGGGEGWHKEEGEGRGEGKHTPGFLQHPPGSNYLEISLHPLIRPRKIYSS
jgi:hypothetical protein